MDTVLGIFDADGNLLLGDDDSGVGTLSRLLVQVAVDGTYAVGVSTYPDLTFTGAGGDFGRYVLNISSYRGTILAVGRRSPTERRGRPVDLQVPVPGHELVERVRQRQRQPDVWRGER